MANTTPPPGPSTIVYTAPYPPLGLNHHHVKGKTDASRPTAMHVGGQLTARAAHPAPSVIVGEIQQRWYGKPPSCTGGGCVLLVTGLLPCSVVEAPSPKAAQGLPTVSYFVARKLKTFFNT